MNAFDMISEPILFTQGLHEYSSRVHHCVELTQSLADAVLAEDYTKLGTLHEEMSAIWHEMNQSKLALYSQIKGMHFHVAGGDAFSQYMTSQDRVADSLQGLASLLVLRKTPVPTPLRDPFRALVAAVVNTGRQTMSLAEAAFSEDQMACADTQAQNLLDATRATAEGKGQTREREAEFTRHLYGIDKQLDPVTLMFLDKCGTALHEVADNAERAAEALHLMIR